MFPNRCSAGSDRNMFADSSADYSDNTADSVAAANTVHYSHRHSDLPE